MLAQLRTEGGEHLFSRINEDHPCVGGVDVPVGADEGLVRELADLPGHLHAGRAAADDHESEEAPALHRISAGLGPLEGIDDAAANFQGVVDRLEPGGELCEMLVAEIRLIGAGGDDERIVRQRDLDLAAVDAGRLKHERTGLEIDVGHHAEQRPRVLLLFQHRPGERGDLADGEHAGGDLVEQRLEQVVADGGHHRHVDIGIGEGSDRRKPPEAGAHDDHMVPAGGGIRLRGLRGHRSFSRAWGLVGRT